jgi:hypothetical protein
LQFFNWSVVRGHGAMHLIKIIVVLIIMSNEKSHFSYFNDQAESVVGKTLNSEQLQSQVKTLLNQQLFEGKVN